jgi:hypothetical protein
VNDSSGALDLCDVDEAAWYYHPNQDIDIAVMQIGIAGADWQPFPYEGFADHEQSALFSRFGVGDLVYIVGLYRLLPGRAKMSPIVHTGHVAMTPGEDIPIYNTTTKKTINTRGYLVEAQTLEGLSGSPVFVRYTNPTGMSSGVGRVVAYTDSVFLLGVWQGAWDGIPGDILSEEIGSNNRRVPVGMGITIPSRRITEVLELPELKERRQQGVERDLAENAAKTG